MPGMTPSLTAPQQALADHIDRVLADASSDLPYGETIVAGLYATKPGRDALIAAGAEAFTATLAGSLADGMAKIAADIRDRYNPTPEDNDTQE